MGNILIINGHPYNKSLCHAIASSYNDGAQVSMTCTTLNLGELKFDPILHFGYSEKMELEPDLIHAQNLIKAADHIVFVYPNWWGTYPALLKGFIDRLMLPGFGFKYIAGKKLPEKLLINKTGRIIITMNTPKWFYKLVYMAPGVRAIRDCVMKFCGISKIKTTIISPSLNQTPEMYKKILGDVQKLGARDAAKL